MKRQITSSSYMAVLLGVALILSACIAISACPEDDGAMPEDSKAYLHAEQWLGTRGLLPGSVLCGQQTGERQT